MYFRWEQQSIWKFWFMFIVKYILVKLIIIPQKTRCLPYRLQQTGGLCYEISFVHILKHLSNMSDWIAPVEKYSVSLLSDSISIDVRCNTCSGAGVNNAGSFYKTTACQPDLWWRPSLGFWKQSLQLLEFGWYSSSRHPTSRPSNCILLVVLLGSSMNIPK